MATIADLAIGLTVRAGPAIKGFARVTKSVRSFGGGIARAATRIGALGAALATAATGGGLALLIKRQTDLIDSTVKTAQKLGLTTDALVGLQHAAELSGVAARTFDMGLQRMTRRLAEAAMGTGEAKGALTELFGPDGFQRLAQFSPDKQFAAIADAMENIGSQSDRVRLGFKLFDSEGVALINTLRGGSAALKLSQAEAKQFGLTIGEVGGQQVVAFKTAMLRAKGVVAGFGRQLSVQLAPFLEAAAEKFTVLATAGGGVGAKVQMSMRLMSLSVVSVLNALSLLKIGILGVKAAALDATRAVAGPLDVMARALVRVSDVLGVNTKRAAKSLGSSFGGGNSGINKAIRETAEVLEHFGRTAGRVHGKNVVAVNAYFDAIRKGSEAAARMALDANKGRGGGLFDLGLLNKFKKMEQFKKSLFDATRTPLEKYGATIGNLNQVLDEGIIGWELYARGVRKARAELEGFNKTNVSATAALERGTAAAFHAERQQFDPNKGESIGVILEQLKEARQARQLLERQVELMEAQQASQVVGIV